jgi:GH24 family phage-related lysozyme (muramidase)
LAVDAEEKQMRKTLIFVLILFGTFFGIVWYFDVEQAGGDWSDFFSDPVGGTTSLFSRFGLWIISLGERFKGVTGVGTVDPVALATGMIAGFESFSSKSYPDPPGQSVKYSIGYGHQIIEGDGFDQTSIISEQDALALLNSDISSRFVPCVDAVVTVPVTPQMQAAMYSLCYNIGCGAFKSSTLLSDLNNGDSQGALDQFSVWNKSGGQVLQSLVDRRASEASVFQSGIPASSDSSSTDDTTANSDSGEQDSEGE